MSGEMLDVFESISTKHFTKKVLFVFTLYMFVRLLLTYLQDKHQKYRIKDKTNV